MFNKFIHRKLSYLHRKILFLFSKKNSIFLISEWHRLTLPLPLATLQQNYIRFRISTPSYVQITEPWAIDRGKENTSIN